MTAFLVVAVIVIVSELTQSMANSDPALKLKLNEAANSCWIDSLFENIYVQNNYC